MYEVKLYYATVIDNDDQNHDDGSKKGRIKIKVLPEMEGIKDDFLPWVEPFFTRGMAEGSFSYHSPEIGDKVWVIFIDKFWKNGYYLTGAFISGFFAESDVTSKMGDIAETVDTIYPNLKFEYMIDGSLLFYNTDTGDKGFINKNGWYFFIDTDGKTYWYFVDQEMKIYNDNTEIYIEDDGKITVTTNNDIQVTNDGITFDLKNDGTYKIDGEGSIECVIGGQVKINGTSLTVDK